MSTWTDLADSNDTLAEMVDEVALEAAPPVVNEELLQPLSEVLGGDDLPF